MRSQTGRRQETNRKRFGSKLAFFDSREKVVKFAFGEFELRVDNFFHVEAFFILNFTAKASFLYVG